MHELTPNLKPLPINGQPSGLKLPNKKPKKSIILYLMVFLGVVIGGALIGSALWYNNQLKPIGSDIGKLQLFTAKDGSSMSQIASELQDAGIIRNSFVFGLYVRISGNSDNLKAGTYRLSPAESTQQIVEHLVNGSVDQFSITFYPGATLVDNSSTKSKKYDVTTVLRNAGYQDDEIIDALNTVYESPLFSGKPQKTGLEGYIYGETYNFNVGASVRDIFTKVFDEFYSVVQENNLIDKFAKKGLDLYQGITLASIIQREANLEADQRQIAQVFHSRLNIGMQLGSDVTYQYIADKDGLVRSPDLDSPYNTRRYAGLPPGPIAVPGLSALLSVANPADGDYLYFLSGDDDITYFARTGAEHEANIVNHCKIKCLSP